MVGGILTQVANSTGQALPQLLAPGGCLFRRELVEFITRAWQQAYARSPRPDELTAARQFLTAQAERIGAEETDVPTVSQPQPCPSCLEPHRAAAYVDLCHALLNSTEFLFVD